MSHENPIDQKTTTPDDLTKTTSNGNVELTEQDLSKASGGAEAPVEYLKFKLTDVIISG